MTARDVSLDGRTPITLSVDGRFLAYARSQPDERGPTFVRVELAAGQVESASLPQSVRLASLLGWSGSDLYVQYIEASGRWQQAVWEYGVDSLSVVPYQDDVGDSLDCSDCIVDVPLNEARAAVARFVDGISVDFHFSRDLASPTPAYYTTTWYLPDKAGQPSIYRLSSSTRELIMKHAEFPWASSIRSLRASPSGEWVAFVVITSARSPVPLPARDAAVWVVSRDGTQKQKLMVASHVGQLAWSRDSAELYVAARLLGESVGNGGVFRVSVQGTVVGGVGEE